jgi:hypothetical protein
LHFAYTSLNSFGALSQVQATPSSTGESQAFLDRGGLGVRAEAARADVGPNGDAIDDQRLLMDVCAVNTISARRLSHPATGVLVANVSTEHRTPTADITFHSDFPL